MSNDNGPDNSPEERQDDITEEGPLTCNVFVRGLVRRQPDLAWFGRIFLDQFQIF